MRDDQRKRLQDLSERLADAFIMEADPSEWPGDGKPPADLEQQERGDRYWCKKNAMATGGVLRFTLDLIERNGPGGPSTDDDADLDKRIRDAEKRAAQATKRVLDKASKLKFDAKINGKG
jgi:hypothetical protein